MMGPKEMLGSKDVMAKTATGLIPQRRFQLTPTPSETYGEPAALVKFLDKESLRLGQKLKGLTPPSKRVNHRKFLQSQLRHSADNNKGGNSSSQMTANPRKAVRKDASRQGLQKASLRALFHPNIIHRKDASASAKSSGSQSDTLDSRPMPDSFYTEPARRGQASEEKSGSPAFGDFPGYALPASPSQHPTYDGFGIVNGALGGISSLLTDIAAMDCYVEHTELAQPDFNDLLCQQQSFRPSYPTPSPDSLGTCSPRSTVSGYCSDTRCTPSPRPPSVPTVTPPWSPGFPTTTTINNNNTTTTHFPTSRAALSALGSTHEEDTQFPVHTHSRIFQSHGVGNQQQLLSPSQHQMSQSQQQLFQSQYLQHQSQHPPQQRIAGQLSSCLYEQQACGPVMDHGQTGLYGNLSFVPNQPHCLSQQTFLHGYYNTTNFDNPHGQHHLHHQQPQHAQNYNLTYPHHHFPHFNV